MRSKPLISSHGHHGLTVVEVLFAMVIILVGLIGIASIVPFAGRQAEDSYKITHGLAVGESALRVFTSQSIGQPRLNAPWQIVDDTYYAVDSNFSIAKSWDDIYRTYLYNNRFGTLGISPPYNTQMKRELIARLQNQILGTGFCIDPMFWGYQERDVRIAKGDRGNYRRTRFPFYDETLPGASGTPFSTPRLLRVSQADPLGPNTIGNGGWLRLASSIQLATISGGDLISALPESDRSAAPLRGEYVDGSGALLQSPTNAATVSWLATLTPSDGTPMVTADGLTFINDINNVPNYNARPNIEFFPEKFDLSVVVFGKRDVRELLDPTNGIIPSSERLGIFNVIGTDVEYLTSGTFDFEVSSSADDSRVKIGNWLMLSRYIYENPYAQGTNAATQMQFARRERHKWYRVISVGNEESFPRQIRVSGQPWDWTEFEVAEINRLRLLNPALTWPVVPTTVVTLLKDVVQVYQRSVTLQPF